MFNTSSARSRYTQFFALFMLCAITYMMAQSIGAGITDFQDNLYKKDFLIEMAVRLRMKLGDRVFPQVLLEKDGWMGYTAEGELDYFQNARPLQNQNIIAKDLANLNQYLKSQDITLLIVVAPSKSSIYPDKIPAEVKLLSTRSKLDGLILSLKRYNLPIIVDLRPALRTARQVHDVYYKTNTHWNGYGAFVAYTTIINTLGHSYPELKPYQAIDLNLVITGPDTQDLARIMHANFITEPNVFFTPKELSIQTLHPSNYLGYNQFSSLQNSELPTLLMFHDSFGAMYLNYYLSMNFGLSHFVHLDSMPEYLTKESIQQFKPDVIIIEILERNLGTLANRLSNFASK